MDKDMKKCGPILFFQILGLSTIAFRTGVEVDFMGFIRSSHVTHSMSTHGKCLYIQICSGDLVHFCPNFVSGIIYYGAFLQKQLLAPNCFRKKKLNHICLEAIQLVQVDYMYPCQCVNSATSGEKFVQSSGKCGFVNFLIIIIFTYFSIYPQGYNIIINHVLQIEYENN